jgi:hypothetical protein
MPPRVLVGLATIVAAACLWPLFLVFQWFGVNIATLERMTRTDPLGFRVFPAFVMFLRPTLAAAAALSALRAAVLVITHPQRSRAILLPAAIVQAVLALAIVLTGPAIDRTLADMLPLFEDRQTPGAIIAADFTRMQAEASAAILLPLVAIAAACALAAFMTRRSSNGE